MTHPQATILIAEDSPDEVFLLRHAFKRSGLTLDLQFVKNGQEAMDYLERKPPYDDPEKFPFPTALVLDIKMPLVTGLEVLARLKDDPTLSYIPAVIHSSSAHENDRAQAARLGARAYYVKSAHLEDSIAMFRSVAEKFVSIPRRVGPSSMS